MAIYKRKSDFHTLGNVCEPFLMFLRKNCEVIKEDGTTPVWDIKEAFIVGPEEMKLIDERYSNLRQALQLSPFMEIAPLSEDWEYLMLYVNDDPSGFKPTVSPTHVRLPKLSHLITLTPDDFFAVFRIIATGKKVSIGNSFSLPGDIAMPPTVAQFFVTNDRTYRTNPDYADRKWTTKADIEFLATLEPTPYNQLCAMQYLTAKQNSGDLLYFPLDSAIQLELEWSQINEDYVIPEGE